MIQSFPRNSFLKPCCRYKQKQQQRKHVLAAVSVDYSQQRQKETDIFGGGDGKSGGSSGGQYSVIDYINFSFTTRRLSHKRAQLSDRQIKEGKKTNNVFFCLCLSRWNWKQTGDSNNISPVFGLDCFCFVVFFANLLRFYWMFASFENDNLLKSCCLLVFIVSFCFCCRCLCLFSEFSLKGYPSPTLPQNLSRRRVKTINMNIIAKTAIITRPSKNSFTLF